MFTEHLKPPKNTPLLAGLFAAHSMIPSIMSKIMKYLATLLLKIVGIPASTVFLVSDEKE